MYFDDELLVKFESPNENLSGLIAVFFLLLLYSPVLCNLW